MISARSRYADSPVVLLKTSRGSVVSLARKQPRPKRIEYTFIRVQAETRIDHLAKNAFGDEKMWWIIADANPEILDWTSLPMGTTLRLPRG